MLSSRTLLVLGLVPLLATAQLSSPVGPTTSYSMKANHKICNVLNYGAVADNSTDVGTAISSAWDDCKTGGVVYIPSGDYALATWVDLTGGSSCAIVIDGIIYRTGKDGGAFQGFGYEFHAGGDISGPRILRLYDVADFSVHDLALVDSPSFHFSMDTCENGEVYNMIVRGGNEEDLTIEVTNKDEQLTASQSPARNILVESIYCNWSGGCAMGSLATGTNISDITYRNIYTWSSNQMYMIKSNGGDGNVDNVVLENFIGHGNAYSLDIDQYWSSQSTSSGDGVQLNNITIRNWKGTAADGAKRGPIKVACAEGAPCTDITIEDFAIWTEEGDYEWYSCESAYGEGACP
ncbi:hypothetical protein N7468_006260 [Penicillium chermesinum]|uniref:Rhamnogalacturonase A/B/Epimerase-like pectate lyase domain-containing protein n=1 Tax=Penicillium chermesinum TaxID=63820 RepID=A0A9W9TKZ2_9EURO|nr:uncharacterized protein N7468_006260 [Penicillium chermesinum]KAJ5225035.1 hypothetical protein N7468_006260 [Penicillium chermesinum]